MLPKYDNLPNPDFWTTLLWRRLVGHVVLRTDQALTRGRSVRVYAFCSAERLGHVGGVTLAVVQTRDTEVQLDLELLPGTGGPRGEADLYVLSSYPGQPISRDIFLNGRVLQLLDEETMELPTLEPTRLSADQPIVMPGKSYGFVVLPNAGAAVCSQPWQQQAA